MSTPGANLRVDPFSSCAHPRQTPLPTEQHNRPLVSTGFRLVENIRKHLRWILLTDQKSREISDEVQLIKRGGYRQLTHTGSRSVVSNC